MEISVIKELGYQDSFKGSINQPGKPSPAVGTFKILSNNAAEKRMSVKTKDGIIMQVPYGQISSIDNVGKNLVQKNYQIHLKKNLYQKIKKKLKDPLFIMI